MKKHEGLFSPVRWLLIFIAFTGLVAGLKTQLVQAKASTLETDFQQAAAKYKVPVDLLKAVAYNESAFESHNGKPSVAGGYGVMHLTDTAGLTPSGADSKAVKVPNAASLHTVQKAVKLTGLSASQIKTNSADNINGGAALLAAYQKSLGKSLTSSIGGWDAAVKKYVSRILRLLLISSLPMCIKSWLKASIIMVSKSRPRR